MQNHYKNCKKGESDSFSKGILPRAVTSRKELEGQDLSKWKVRGNNHVTVTRGQ